MCVCVCVCVCARARARAHNNVDAQSVQAGMGLNWKQFAALQGLHGLGAALS